MKAPSSPCFFFNPADSLWEPAWGANCALSLPLRTPETCGALAGWPCPAVWTAGLAGGSGRIGHFQPVSSARICRASCNAENISNDNNLTAIICKNIASSVGPSVLLTLGVWKERMYWHAMHHCSDKVSACLWRHSTRIYLAPSILVLILRIFKTQLFP